jgi:hypothetical protein
VLDEPEAVAVVEMSDVVERSRREIVDAGDSLTTLDQPIADVGAEEPGSAGDDDVGCGHERPTPS